MHAKMHTPTLAHQALLAHGFLHCASALGDNQAADLAGSKQECVYGVCLDCDGQTHRQTGR